jgi:hypothetical protein
MLGGGLSKHCSALMMVFRELQCRARGWEHLRPLMAWRKPAHRAETDWKQRTVQRYRKNTNS